MDCLSSGVRAALLFQITVAIACATGPMESLPVPDAGAGGPASCIPQSCEPSWCAMRSDGCGGVIDCGPCEPGTEDPFDDGDSGDDVDNVPESDGPPCQAGPTQYDFGEYFEKDSIEVWHAELQTLAGDETDLYTVTITDKRFNFVNPKGGFVVRGSGTTAELAVSVEVDCKKGGALKIRECSGGGSPTTGGCKTLVPAGSNEERLGVRWNCIGALDDEATLTARVSAACDEGCGSGCQSYSVGALVKDIP